MICNYCENEFVREHWNQRLCSPECKTLAISRAKAKYKTTDKGIASEARWRKNPIKKKIDKQYMQTSDARAKAVIRATRCLANSPELQEKKRQRDKAFARTEYGRKLNKKASAKYRKTEKGKQARKNSKARRRGADGGFTHDEWKVKLHSFDCKCVHCGSQMCSLRKYREY